MLPRPRGEHESQRLADIGEEVIVIFNDRPYYPWMRCVGNNLHGLIGYPVTYFVGTDRIIDDLFHGWGVPSGLRGQYPAEAGIVNRRNFERLNTAVQHLLK